MAGSRAPMRYASVALALAHWGLRRRKPEEPRRILVLHHLLLGDTLMLTALLAKLRQRYPAAEIAMTVPPAYAPLYEGRPYGVVAHAFDPRDFATFRKLRALPRFDLAILPADNRWSWLARALSIPYWGSGETATRGGGFCSSSSRARVFARPPEAANAITRVSSPPSNHVPCCRQTSTMTPEILPKFTRFICR